jgi:hypothetical protein
MSAITADDLNSVLQKVQEKLTAREQQSGVSLAVSREASRLEDEWLYVVVSPTRAGIRAYDYVSTLGQVERELKQEGFEHVLLVPAIAD